MLRCVHVAKISNDAGKEKGDGVESTVGTEVDHDHDVKFGISKSFPDIFRFESNFLVGRVLGKSDDTDLTFSSGHDS